MNKIGYILLLTAGLIMGACNDDTLSGPTPTERSQANIEQLRAELSDAPHGWKLLYFPTTDSLLFSNLNTSLGMDDQHGHYGYGGFYYLLKFDKQGNVTLKADHSPSPAEEQGRYVVHQSSSTQLSLTTFTSLHTLIGTAFKGTSHFLYARKDFDGSLVFRTMNYMKPAKEYIVMQRLDSDEAWNDNIKQAYDNRSFFESMKNPQIRIHTGAMVHFQSDMNMKAQEKHRAEITSHRYYLFTFTKELAADPDAYPRTVVGLGSGYAGTETGLSFHAGIRLNANHVFHDFERVDDKFICELVQVYDPHTLRPYLMAKHLAPKGQYKETGYIAEIFDMPTKR